MNPSSYSRAAHRSHFWQPQTTAVVDSHYDQCFDVVKRIVALAENHGYDEHDRFAISLSLHEAIANAITHGNGSKPFKKVRIEYAVSEWEVRMRITDEGRGFDRESVRDPRLAENLDRPHGRGLLLMRASMSGIRFNAAGNQVEFWKRRRVLAGRSARSTIATHQAPADGVATQVA